MYDRVWYPSSDAVMLMWRTALKIVCGEVMVNMIVTSILCRRLSSCKAVSEGGFHERRTQTSLHTVESDAFDVMLESDVSDLGLQRKQTTSSKGCIRYVFHWEERQVVGTCYNMTLQVRTRHQRIRLRARRSRLSASS
jgi:hypothetical protein